jgi:hypothetical protein
MAAALKTWVNDRLHEILGMSDSSVVEFLVGFARESGSTASYLMKLERQDVIQMTPETENFLCTLWAKVFLLNHFVSVLTVVFVSVF